MMNNKFTPMNEESRLSVLTSKTIEAGLKELININDGVIEWNVQNLPQSFHKYPHIYTSTNNVAIIDRIYVVNNVINYDYHFDNSLDHYSSTITDCGFNEWQASQMIDLYDSVICREQALINNNNTKCS